MYLPISVALILDFVLCGLINSVASVFIRLLMVV